MTLSGSAMLTIRCSGAYAFENATASSSVSQRSVNDLGTDCRTMLARGSTSPWRSSSSSIAATCVSVRPTVSSTTWLSGPCSACDSRSAATYAGLADASAMTSTSDGPAGMSIATMALLSFCTSIFAAVTYWLPGPQILSTLGTDSVPYAIANTACAPPALRMRDAPICSAMYSTSGAMLPSGPGGLARMISLHPATLAGTPSMYAVDGRIAVPPGTYRPTRSIGRVKREHTTPGIVSSASGADTCASWKRRTLPMAKSIAVLTSGSSCTGLRAGSRMSCTGELNLTRSNFSVSSSRAASPRERTASWIGRTRPMMSDDSTIGRLSRRASAAASSCLR
eukprot:Unigene5691_Nuclearia_a/m.17369 Unigene5691_Nuclearia_a/g.17369  ORF Unigene5691_Nuclearia_a/g.17369 Unigene5691_Nuclearia_a/m.17369 type:complete len:338 (+) Unigene5691_Nuclearia_a:353-1366(+)